MSMSKFDKVMLKIETSHTVGQVGLLCVACIKFSLEHKLTQSYIGYISIESLERSQINRGTISWVMQNRKFTWDTIKKSNKNTVDVLTELSGFLLDMNSDFELWCNGSNFVEPIIAENYSRCGMVTPYRFDKVRDLRTVLSLFDRTMSDFSDNSGCSLAECEQQIIALNTVLGKL
jgi:3' exoribonuclease, RNase T-like